MRLLVVTQAVDRTDPALGFFVSWIEELAKHAQKTTAVCLKKGEYDLPKDVGVFSLGKETSQSKKRSRSRYALRFLYYAWQLRKDYDAVFVHMNEEYVLLGGLFWKLLGKKVFLWRNHYRGSFWTDIAALFCTKVFYTSRFSYTAKFRNAVKMPVGVGAQQGHDSSTKRLPRSILFLARLDESKRPEVLLEALGKLAQEKVEFIATIAGEPSNPYSSYPEKLRTRAQELGISAQVRFAGAIPAAETPRYYRAHEIFVNCSRSGMLDKTIFEAAAYGCFVLASSKDILENAGERFYYKDADTRDLAEKIKKFLLKDEEEKTRATSSLVHLAEQNSLQKLGERLAEELA